MSAQSEYRRQAEFCEKMSQRSATLETRAAWLRLASKWRSLVSLALRKPVQSDESAQSPAVPVKFSADR